MIDAPPGSEACDSANRFVLGGVGDVSGLLDAESKDLYLFFSHTSLVLDPARDTCSCTDAPQNGGSWYPRVVGMEPGSGTDRLAGRRARFFMTGRSERMIEFER